LPGGVIKAVVAPPPGELFSETNENSVAVLLSYGTARVLLAGDAEAREEEYMASDRCSSRICCTEISYTAFLSE
jgi:beta-lactamase superfamily II metal-dependent hydrolase